MKSLNDYESKRQTLLKSLEDYKKHAVEVNDFIMKEVSRKYRNKTSFIAGTFEDYNSDQYGNKFDLSKITIFGELMSKTIEENPKLKLQLLQSYRTQVNAKIRSIEIAIDLHTKKAIEYLKNQNGKLE